MQKKLIISLIIILFAVIMIADFRINGVSIFESFFKEMETDSMRKMYSGNFADNYQGPSAETEVNNREILVSDNIEYLFIDNQRGSIDIVGEKRDDILLSYKLSVYAESEELAESFIEELGIIDMIEGNELILELKEYKKPKGVYAVKVAYDLIVPERILLNIKNHYGKLSVTNMDQDVLLRNNFDKMEVRDIAGKTELFAHYGNVFVKNIGDDLEIEAAYNSQLDISNIEGDLLLKNNYGQARVDRVAGDIDFDSSYGAAYFDEIDGNINLVSKYSEIRGSDISGVFRGNIKYGQLNIIDLSNDVKIDGHYAGLEINLKRDLSDYEVYGETRYGNINSELPFQAVKRDNNHRILEGKEGTGAVKIHLINEHGDIRLNY